MSHSDAGVRPKVQYFRRVWACTVMCAAIAAVTACGSEDTTTTAPTGDTGTTTAATAAPETVSPAPTSAAQITIESFGFGDQVTVPQGAQVTVINKDSAEHSVTSDTKGLFDSEVHGNKQATFNAPSAPGSYPFHCTYHPSMHGVLVVQ